MSEAKYQSKLIKQLEADGWYVLKLIKTNKNGIPDVLALKDGHKPYFIEVKGAKGKLSELQKYRLKELKDYGFNAEAKFEPI